MLSKYKFLKTAPAEYKSLWAALSTGMVHPSHYASFQLFLHGKKVDQSIVSYNPKNRDEYAVSVGNELFMLRIDLRNGWTGLHFCPDWDSINLWLKGNASQTAEQEYISFLVTQHSIFTLHFNVKFGEVTVNAYVRALNEPVQSQETNGILLSCEEVSLARYALNLMYHTLATSSTDFDRKRMAKVAELENRLSEELKTRHEAEIAHIRSIGQEVQQ